MSVDILDGESPVLFRDLARIFELSTRARETLWGVLGPSLPLDVPNMVGPLLERYCEEHKLPPDDIARLVRAWRHVLRRAHEHSLHREEVLRLVSKRIRDEHDLLDDFLKLGFDAASNLLTTEAGDLALLEHYRALSSTQFRIERIEHSQHGRASLKIATFTLLTREGKHEERFSFSANREALVAMRDALDRALNHLG